MNIVKTDLLRRKIHEHISKYPKAKSFIVKARFGEENTHWKVEVKKNRSFSIVEVNTTRSEYIIKEAMTKFRKEEHAFADAIGAGLLSDKQGDPKFAGDYKYLYSDDKVDHFKSLKRFDYVKSPITSGDKPMSIMHMGADRDDKEKLQETPPKFRDAQQAFGNAIENGVLTDTPGPKYAGDHMYMYSDDQKDYFKNVNSRKYVESNITSGDKPSSAMSEAASSTASMPGKEPEDVDPGSPTDQDIKPDKDTPPDSDESGLETDPDASTDPESQEPQRTRTGEELHLKQLVDNKPVKDIEVEVTDTGGSITLKLAGLENPLKINLDDGRGTYELGDLSRALRTSTKSD